MPASAYPSAANGSASGSAEPSTPAISSQKSDYKLSSWTSGNGNASGSARPNTDHVQAQ